MRRHAPSEISYGLSSARGVVRCRCGGSVERNESAPAPRPFVAVAGEWFEKNKR